MSGNLHDSLRAHLCDELRNEPVEVAVRHTVHWFRSPESDVEVADVDAKTLRREAWNVAIDIVEEWREDDLQRMVDPEIEW